MKRFTHGRRAWVAGVAGALAAWPLHRVVRADPTSAKRFVFFVSGNGYDAQVTMSPRVREYIADSRGRPVDEHLWWGTGYAAGEYAHDPESAVRIDGALSGAPGLRAFEAAGLLDRCAMLYGLSSKITGGGHDAAHGPLSSTRTIGGRPGGETIDSYLSRLDSVRGVGEHRTPFPAIRVGSTAGTTSIGYGLCAGGRGRALPVLYSPQATFEAYVRPFVDPSGVEQLDYRERLLEVAERGAMHAAGTLEGVPGEQARALLEAARAKREDEVVLRRRIEALSGRLTDPPGAPAAALDPHEYLRFQTRVAASAIEAGLTNVVVVSIGAGNGNWAFRYQLGPVTTEDSSHAALYHPYSDLGSTSEEQARARARRAELREAWARELDAVAALAQHLDSLPEPNGEGTMLDNTVIAYLPANGVGHHALPRDFPTLLVGGERMGIRTGNAAIVYPEANGSSSGRRELVHLWSTFGVALAGAPSDDDGLLPGFGDPSSRIAPGLLGDLVE